MRQAVKIMWMGMGFLCLGLGKHRELRFLYCQRYHFIWQLCFVLQGVRAKLHQWFIETQLYKKHLESFVTKREMTMEQNAEL